MSFEVADGVVFRLPEELDIAFLDTEGDRSDDEDKVKFEAAAVGVSNLAVFLSRLRGLRFLR